MKPKKCLIFEYTKLPKDMKEIVSEWVGFHNDCLLPFSRRSEYEPKELAKGMKAIEDYWQDQTKTNGFKGTLEEFIEECGLQFEIWLINRKQDYSDVDEILIDICW